MLLPCLPMRYNVPKALCSPALNAKNGFAYLALQNLGKGVKIGCPNIAKCSCYLGPGGRAGRHTCSFAIKSNNLILPWTILASFLGLQPNPLCFILSQISH